MDDLDIATTEHRAMTHLNNGEKRDRKWPMEPDSTMLAYNQYTKLPTSDNYDCEHFEQGFHHRQTWFLPLFSVLLVLLLGVYTIKSMTGIATSARCRSPDADADAPAPPNVDFSLPTQPRPAVAIGPPPTPPPHLDALQQLHVRSPLRELHLPAVVVRLGPRGMLLRRARRPTSASSKRAPRLPSTDPMDARPGPRRRRGWPYFADKPGRDVVPLATVVQGESAVLYTTWLQHMWHFAFTWRKILMWLNGGPVGLTERDLSEGHTGHCGEMVVDAGVWDLHVGSTICWRWASWSVGFRRFLGS